MARRRSRKISTKSQPRRVPHTNTRPVLHRRRLPSVPTLSTHYSPLPNWHPPFRDARIWPRNPRLVITFSGPAATLRPARTPFRTVYPSSQVRVATPKRAFLCARRQIRREVLFAHGRGGRGNRPPRYNQQSKVICR